jgi:hypothetical protein
MVHRVQVRAISSDEGNRLLRIVRRSSGSVVNRPGSTSAVGSAATARFIRNRRHRRCGSGGALGRRPRTARSARARVSSRRSCWLRALRFTGEARVTVATPAAISGWTNSSRRSSRLVRHRLDDPRMAGSG